MNAKSRPNRQLYLRALARMTPEERLRKAFELSEMTKELFVGPGSAKGVPVGKRLTPVDLDPNHLGPNRMRRP